MCSARRSQARSSMSAPLQRCNHCVVHSLKPRRGRFCLEGFAKFGLEQEHQRQLQNWRITASSFDEFSLEVLVQENSRAIGIDPNDFVVVQLRPREPNSSAPTSTFLIQNFGN